MKEEEILNEYKNTITIYRECIESYREVIKLLKEVIAEKDGQLHPPYIVAPELPKTDTFKMNMKIT